MLSFQGNFFQIVDVSKLSFTMAMVVSNWQEHSSRHPTEDVNGLPPLSQPPIDPVTTLPQVPHHPNMVQQQTAPPAAPPQLHQSAPPIQPDPGTLTRPPQTPSTPGNGSVSDGSNVTSLGECTSNPRPQVQAGTSSSSDKPHIECVVSPVVCVCD